MRTENPTQRSNAEIEIYKKITKSGYEENLMIEPPENVPSISLILVTFNSEIWFENLKKMFINLSPWLHEIIVVDNGSKDGSYKGLSHSSNNIKIIENKESKSFAAAVNQGCKLASGELFLIINPDVYIPKSSLWSLINFYQNNSDAAAIVPKLMLMKTPGFINGIGNVVPPFRWGYDLGLGHLDVGQFDHIKEVPSACFATVLIPREKWKRLVNWMKNIQCITRIPIGVIGREEWGIKFWQIQAVLFIMHIVEIRIRMKVFLRRNYFMLHMAD